MMPIGPLMMEHRVIERMISVLSLELKRIRESSEPDTMLLREGIDFLRTYADRTHHGKEEDILFRDMVRKDLSPGVRGTMEDLMQDHRMARENTKALLKAIEGLDGGDSREVSKIEQRLTFLTALYPRHIETEDKRFFMPSMDYFSEEEREKMLQEFLDFDRGMIHEKYEGMVNRLESGVREERVVMLDEAAEGEHSQDKWICTVCDWVYDPSVGDLDGNVPPGVAFEELPDDWVCPQCGAEKDAFERLTD